MSLTGFLFPERTGAERVVDIFSMLPKLESERLIIRPVNMRDAKDIYAYSKDPDVARYVLWDAYESLKDARVYIRFLRRCYRSGSPASMGIELKQEKKIIGTIGFMTFQPDAMCAEVGYSLSKEYWNRGIMTEALERMLKFGFEDLQLHRIEAMHEVRNPASGRVMQKCRMTLEGTMRQKLYNKGEWVDVNLYSILQEEWKEKPHL
ncbi:MAG: GNAT family N-acetyltransferase [Clostridia bacterium]|nr:GNAT family N-acetyltransferase [Clostridia bacterium]